MERGLALLPLLVGVLQQGSSEAGGELLEVWPPEPVVALGGFLQLTCRLNCSDGAKASVQWKGLDTSLGSVKQEAEGSVLTVRKASRVDEGTRICEGSCRDTRHVKTVQIVVFAFPGQLTVSPQALVAGRRQEVACTAHNVTPTDPNILSLSLLLGNRELEGAQVLSRETEAEPQRGEDELYRVTKQWRLPPFEPPVPPALHCQATMRLPGLELSHLLPIPVLPISTTKEPEVTASVQAPPEQDSRLPSPPASPPSPGPTPGNTSTGPCHLEIRQLPVPGGLELLCEATCGPGGTVRWTQAPGGLAAYKWREAGTQAWLSVRWASCSPEGWFQCQLDPGGRRANLYVAPEMCRHPVSADLWTSSLVLGLLLLALLACHLRRRCRCRHAH
ncbi:PREDICTED: mucosal addressin cell adhesion molecule 1 [Condylura cristata]|uniref:mucosal addressin cell adhesion molecule 1 n=1 Tax=Condylura cristata TaxID=143302 RepID=UPI0006435136|nr:PREDICTED: mucosal addressin cell adhesion molecule 1 [Condylura cristata]